MREKALCAELMWHLVSYYFFIVFLVDFASRDGLAAGCRAEAKRGQKRGTKPTKN